MSPEPTPAPSENEAAVGIDDTLQPVQGAAAVDAAAQMIEIHRALLEEGRFADACLLYRPEFAAQLAELAGLSASSATSRVACEAMLHEAFVVQTEEAFASADALDEMPLTPAFFVPASIGVDVSQITADETWLAYVPSSAVTSLDDTVFRDGAGLTPAWLARSHYIQLGDDGMWRFAAATERDDRG